MRIYVPSCGRYSFLGTLSHLPKQLLARTTLVVQKQERAAYVSALSSVEGFEKVQLMVLPPQIKTIAPTRSYIVREAVRIGHKKIVMLDDDIRFDWRRVDDNGKFLVATEAQVLELFKTIEKQLDSYAHVGVLAREGGNRVLKFPFVENSRMMRVLGYRTDIVTAKVKVNRIPLMEDFDVCLQLLRKGYKNCVLTGWVQGQGTSGAAGGCSTFRTIELHNACANKLAELHPDYVKVVTKQTKGAWGGEARQDVVVSWKKAYESSQK